MHSSTRQAIQNILDTFNRQCRAEAPENYLSLKKTLFQLELRKDSRILKRFLEERPDTFPTTFKQRCLERCSLQKTAIPFNVFSNTPSNKLYWQMAMCLFEPRTLQDMLNILWPGISKRLRISVTEVFPYKLTSSILRDHYNLPLEFKTEAIDMLPSFNDLRYYVMGDGCLLDVRDIIHFSLPLHARVKSRLDEIYPNLSEKLYQHNTEFETLALNVHSLNEAPKAMIHMLIKRLIAGGSRATGNVNLNVDVHTEKAADWFLTYFDALPESVQTHLNTLEDGDGATLESIIKDIRQGGGCVETIAEHLKEVLQHHQEDSILCSPSRMSEEKFKQLKGRYQTSSLKPEAEMKRSSFPELLLAMAFNKIRPQSVDEFIGLFLTYDTSFYEALLKNIRFPGNPTAFMAVLIDRMQMTSRQERLFNPVQQRTLAEAVIKFYVEKQYTYPFLLHWAIQIQSLLFIREVLKSLDPQALYNALSSIECSEGIPLFISLYRQPEALKLILSALQTLSIEQKHTLIHIQTSDGRTIFNMAEDAPDSDLLSIIQDFLPGDDEASKRPRSESFFASVLTRLKRARTEPDSSYSP